MICKTRCLAGVAFGSVIPLRTFCPNGDSLEVAVHRCIESSGVVFIARSESAFVTACNGNRDDGRSALCGG